jgi:hypothetical protein
MEHLAGADSIDDPDVLRHGGMDLLFDGRAPSTIGSHLRSFTAGRRRRHNLWRDRADRAQVMILRSRPAVIKATR